MATTQKPPERNRALRMLGLPALPKKLPSRNWMIFWTVTTSLSAAIIYDRREKRRATARWVRAVSHIAKEPVASPSELPRRLTVYLESPPGDGFRVAQDHFVEYVKPILAASGLDWEFVQGRMQGDVRAVVAEQIRRRRRAAGEVSHETPDGQPKPEPTSEELIEQMRKNNGIREFDGVRGDIIVGRHTWKEYIRGLHEGWLGPLAPPPDAPNPDYPVQETKTDGEGDGETKEKQESKPKRPPQPKPYNTPEQYSSSALTELIPSELTPSTPIRFPHLLGFLGTPKRFVRFLTRRNTADEIGAQVAAVCLASHREWKSEDEVKDALDFEEKDWVKHVWKDDKGDEDSQATKEKVWINPVVLDPRVLTRMRRFELTADDEARARQIVVPEEEVEGWIKGHLRQLWRWGAHQVQGDDKKIPNVGPIDV